MKQLLLIEDCKEVFQMVKQAIGAIYNLDYVDTLADAHRALAVKEYDLILLDIELPDGNGIEFCTVLQASHPLLPVFFLTSHNSLSEKVLGFSAGAEDYVTKPFSALELKARVESRLKKVELIKAQSDILDWQEIKIDKLAQEAWINPDSDSQKLGLTALEFRLLLYFANRVNAVVSRDEILNELWGDETHVYPRSVDTHVSKLRKKMGEVASIIESVHGVGYKFKPTPRQLNGYV
ncbi:MAG: response regulator transcription factor [Bdellovibrionales bacterium]|nr:response regulator transcription factor [Bdellovibrionales bacterium]